jgi:hypothetical protein
MPGKDRVRRIVKAALVGLAHVALTLGLQVVVSFLSNIATITFLIKNTVRPAEGADGLKTCGVVDERLYV